MNADSYMVKGDTHDVCQDFALAGIVAGSGYALLSDGCSSSCDVDLGARLLAHGALDRLRSCLLADRDFDPVSLAKEAINKAALAISHFSNIEKAALDATLLLAVLRPDGRLRICAWGDGAVLVRQGDAVQAFLLHYVKNAPFYLSYSLDAGRLANFKAAGGGRLSVESLGNAKELVLCPSSPLEPFVVDLALAPGDAAVLVTDGLGQFVDQDNQSISWERLVPDFLSYKQTQGTFLRRRLNFFFRQNRSQNVRHLDDVSAAALIL